VKFPNIDNDGLAFWVCPQKVSGEEVFVLFYGRHPHKENMPSDKCQAVTLRAVYY